MGFIYVLTNKVNGKKYVGQTRLSVCKRISCHKHSKFPIGRAIAKYGWDNFSVETLEYPNDVLDKMEQRFILDYSSINPNGYNLDSGGKNSIRSEVVKEHIRLSKRGEKHPLFGKHQPDETRKKISKTLSGRKRPTSDCKKMSISHKGVPLSALHRQHIGDAHRGTKHSAEWSRKIGDAQRGEKNHAFGKTLSDEHKRKVSEGMKKYQAQKRRRVA